MKGQSLILPPGAFRLMLALAVVANHLTTLQSGRGAVLLFFVLSGYWVADLWDRTQGTDRLAQFFVNRALRIWPLYLAVVCIAVLVAGTAPTFANLALFGIASAPLPHLIGTEWSLDVEVQFYVLLPLLALARDRLGWAGWAALLSVASIAGWRLDSAGLVTALAYLPFFSAGMAIQRLRWQPSAALAHMSLGGFLVLTAVQIALAFNAPALLGAIFGRWPDEGIAALWVIALLPYVAASVAQRSNARDRMRGDLSYPLYLIHAPVVALASQIYDWRTLPGFALLLALIAAATLLLSWLVDRPAERFRKHLLQRNTKPYAGALAA